MASRESLLEVSGLIKHFRVGQGSFGQRDRVVKAVDGIDLRLERGQTLALVGESGCGKTTTIKMLLRLETPTSGAILLNGENVQRMRNEELRRFRRRVQAVFQDPWASLNPRMRVADIIAEPLVYNTRMSTLEIEREVHRVLDDVGLGLAQSRNFPHEFSGGQRQRIAIAAALVSRPELVILDEPVSALDVSIRSQITNLFCDLQCEYGISYLLVTHDLGTTRFMAHSLAVMYLGRIVEGGPTEEIFDRPRHPYTEALLSAALPSHPDAPETTIELDGEPPSPIDPPSGCHFHPRCHRYLGTVCAEVAPTPQIAGSRRISCHLSDPLTVSPATSSRGCQHHGVGVS